MRYFDKAFFKFLLGFAVLILASLCLLAFARKALAQVVINEVMYDLPGTDTGREWIEVYNGGSSSVDLSGWKLFEASTTHALTNVSGGTTLSAGGYAIIADDASKFLIDWPSFAGTLFDSVFSLSNTG